MLIRTGVVARGGLLLLALLLAGCQGLRDLDQWWQQQGESPAQQASAAEAAYRQGLQLSLAGPETQERAVALFQQAADDGHPGAAYLLGMSYLAGQGVGRDPRQALRWLEPLAERGHARAQYHVGEIYMNGAGVAEERAWAVHWYERSARLGYAKAQFAAGVAYASGMGGVTDLQQGFFWLRLADQAQQPHTAALLQRLGPQLGAAERAAADAEARSWQADSTERQVPRGLVRFVQYVLTLESLAPGPLDGVWGPRTAAALQRFQQQHQVQGGGINAATIASLRQRLLADAI
ncbi:tetratricopeptide repeat protein [Motiliproteus sediminis]|uniref:tetratricopeptide repeat protein n=1 Tax=Motiliproteus sediminis TaxID=1468178 RepID=UPI001AEF7B56|nr:tetratricopeptide repeat protein [Motiliproteus sediminis]